ncbi:MAG TPA: sce7726 family protein [Saprospiraceae bacterium]|nr:sce7726 family protein [Saprospiraceae bacterium]
MIIEKTLNLDSKAINLLAKKYNPLDYHIQLVSLLKNALPSYNFDNYSKYELHKFLNDIIYNNYHGEEKYKYMLFQSESKKNDIVAAFEMNVNKSRVDFLTINGYTTSYEIKSELDNLSKVSKQLKDYMLAFEYNYLVLDIAHVEKAKEYIPDGIGIISYSKGKYKQIEKSIYNEKINPEIQLNLLTKKELQTNFYETSGEINTILEYYDTDAINTIFKCTLKERYKKRWDFIKKNKANILPIDLQFFFNTNIQPNYIYYH